jgi:hypothetical protein
MSVMLSGMLFNDSNVNSAYASNLGLNRDHMIGHISIEPEWKAINEDRSDFPISLHPVISTNRNITNKCSNGYLEAFSKYNS